MRLKTILVVLFSFGKMHANIICDSYLIPFIILDYK